MLNPQEVNKFVSHFVYGYVRKSVCACACKSESVSVIIPETAKISPFRISAMQLFNDRVGLKMCLILPDFYKS